MFPLITAIKKPRLDSVNCSKFFCKFSKTHYGLNTPTQALLTHSASKYLSFKRQRKLKAITVIYLQIEKIILVHKLAYLFYSYRFHINVSSVV